jgi:hypothetical protein
MASSPQPARASPAVADLCRCKCVVYIPVQASKSACQPSYLLKPGCSCFQKSLLVHRALRWSIPVPVVVFCHISPVVFTRSAQSCDLSSSFVRTWKNAQGRTNELRLIPLWPKKTPEPEKVEKPKNHSKILILAIWIYEYEARCSKTLVLLQNFSDSRFESGSYCVDGGLSCLQNRQAKPVESSSHRTRKLVWLRLKSALCLGAVHYACFGWYHFLRWVHGLSSSWWATKFKLIFLCPKPLVSTETFFEAKNTNIPPGTI